MPARAVRPAPDAPRLAGRLRGFSATRVAALAATFVLHALALFCLLPPRSSARLHVPPRMIAVRIDLGDVAVPPAPVAATSQAKQPIAATPRPSPPPRSARPRSVPPPSSAPMLEPAPLQTPSETAAAPAQPESSAPDAAETPLQLAMAQAPAASADTAKQASQWQALVLAHLHRYRRYPFAAQRAHVEGTADLRFRVDRRGRVLAVGIERSSGSAALDEEATAVVVRAAPLPPPPEIAGETVEVVLPMQFRLRR